MYSTNLNSEARHKHIFLQMRFVTAGYAFIARIESSKSNLIPRLTISSALHNNAQNTFCLAKPILTLITTKVTHTGTVGSS